jgi:uncharacterized protein involved in propanediol utilization
MNQKQTVDPKAFIGVSCSHHGELLQGEFRKKDKSSVRALITLPSPIHSTKATFIPDHSAIVRGPLGKIKAARAVEFTLRQLGLHSIGGVLELSSNIKIGEGCGSSASDVTASILAVCNFANTKLTPTQIGQIAIKAETAYDPVIFGERALLWAQREGMIVEDFGESLPALAVLGCSLGVSVDTLAFKMPRYSPYEHELFEYLRTAFRRAVQDKNLYLLGRVATISAEINQNYLPKSHFEAIKKIAESVGALGIQVSHTGSIVGILFDPNEQFFGCKVRKAKLYLASLGVQETWLFHTDNESEINNEKAA